MSSWDNLLKDFIKEYKNNPKNWLQQPTISKTVHPNCFKLAEQYFSELKKDDIFNKMLSCSPNETVGTPFRFKQLPTCSPLSIQHYYHLYMIKKHLNVLLPYDVTNFVEIGGGYGNLCRIIKHNNYKGKYTIVDFKEMLNIQKEYLEQHNFDNVNFEVLNVEKLVPPGEDISFLFAAFSINEMPLNLRDELEHIYSSYNYLFFVYNTSFDAINNVEYFSNLADKLQPQFETTIIKDSYKTSWFMLCKRRI